MARVPERLGDLDVRLNRQQSAGVHGGEDIDAGVGDRIEQYDPRFVRIELREVLDTQSNRFLKFRYR